MLQEGFWDDKESSQNVISELKGLKDITTPIIKLKDDVDFNIELLGTIDNNSSDILVMEQDYNKHISLFEQLEIMLLMDGDYDQNDCILEVHSGAGGTEACDWAMMLYRMYSRWCEKNNYKIELLDYQEGEEVGVKSVVISIKGSYAYGYLKNEKGIHRLVRLSPFDANNKRHTSFASVDIIPEIKNIVDVEILESDLKIDVYRASGAGGQHVNTTDSAVRITHLPTKIVVTCQNERSQIKNKEKAMTMLKNKLKMLEIEKQNENINKIRGVQQNIEFGSQIRSYVMHPYSMVKDHRTLAETSNVSGVLDGDIDLFINACLKRRV